MTSAVILHVHPQLKRVASLVARYLVYTRGKYTKHGVNKSNILGWLCMNIITKCTITNYPNATA